MPSSQGTDVTSPSPGSNFYKSRGLSTQSRRVARTTTVICRGAAESRHAGWPPWFCRNHTGPAALSKHKDSPPPSKIPPLPHTVVPLPNPGHHHFPIHRPSPNQQGRQPQGRQPRVPPALRESSPGADSALIPPSHRRLSVWNIRVSFC